MRSVYIPLPEAAVDRLRELAAREMRDPKAQAAWLVVDGLRRAGLDVDLASRERAALVSAPARR
ncbi:MAG: hypothetical protein AABZ33_07670 [Chloroflexota bacterium]